MIDDVGIIGRMPGRYKLQQLKQNTQSQKTNANKDAGRNYGQTSLVVFAGHMKAQ